MTEPSKSKPLIRPADPGDAQALSRLVRDLLLYEREIADSRNFINPWAATESEILKQLASPEMQFFIAEANGNLVGYLRAVIAGREAPKAPGFRKVVEKLARWFYYKVLGKPRPALTIESGYIAGVYVVPEMRREGIARELVEAAENWFKAVGLGASELHVLFRNEAGRKLWEELGYQPLTLGMRKRIGPQPDARLPESGNPKP